MKSTRSSRRRRRSSAPSSGRAVLLEVSRAASYAHRAGLPSACQRADEQLTEHIHQATRPPGIQGPLRRTPHPC